MIVEMIVLPQVWVVEAELQDRKVCIVSYLLLNRQTFRSFIQMTIHIQAQQNSRHIPCQSSTISYLPSAVPLHLLVWILTISTGTLGISVLGLAIRCTKNP
jgi:hypothetical protein